MHILLYIQIISLLALILTARSYISDFYVQQMSCTEAGNQIRKFKHRSNQLLISITDIISFDIADITNSDSHLI